MAGKRGAGELSMMALVFLVATTAAHAQQGPWIRHDPSNHGVIVFVHGITGDGRTTWSSGSSYWPEMLQHDHTFDGQDIYLYHYPSPRLGQTFTIDEIAENMRLVLTTDLVLQHTEITFVSHSMGGIVTRAFILKYRKELVPKIRFLFFFATPTTGRFGTDEITPETPAARISRQRLMTWDNFVCPVSPDQACRGAGCSRIND